MTVPAKPSRTALRHSPRRAQDKIKPVRLAFLDVLGLGLLGLRTRKLRAALSALGISIGVATMVVVTGIPASSHRALMDEMSALGSNMLRVQPFSGQSVPVRIPEESVDMVRRVGPVTEASAVANTGAVVQRSDLIGEDDFSSTGLSVLAARRDLLSVVGGKVFSGRFFSGADEQFPTAVLGYRAASRLGIGEIPENEPAPQIQIDKSWFTVIGILHSIPLADDLDNAVLTGWPAAKKTLRFGGNPTVIYVKARESHLEDVRNVLAATVFPEQPGQVQVSRPSDALAAKRATQNTYSSLFLGLAGVALLVGGIGVANTMVISVLERRRDIGLRRALGATRGQIRVQFLTESVGLSLLGAIAGTLLGVLVDVGYAAYQGWPTVIPLVPVTGGCLGAVLIGVAAGVYPSVRAARLPPTEALAST
ncbi:MULTISPECIES: ABC transporter permease [Streptomyces]|uniref:ABC transporter permease n=1 Tax=Streptomyces lonegramiae TaxID=3075524 RepID=A0ABU2X8I1_9ACTN|nr:ABC transporter permease [Streptomyces sp. DSM 41529]MDT0541258.1 ABC transporter permease [Streptomyces sp. DSM 41529]